ncbi:MAG: class I SAM-dependent methyltransferase [Lentimicrobium sp.]
MNPSFESLKHWFKKPVLFESPVVDHIWNDPWVARKMLEMQIDGESNLVSRNSRFTEKSVAWMIEHLDIPYGSKVCDLGCGAGLYTRSFAMRGMKVHGIDISSAAIDYASQQSLNEDYRILYTCGDYLQGIPGGPFRLTTLLYYDYCAFKPEQRLHLLKNIHKVLEPGGVLILDVFSDVYFTDLTEGNSIRFSETEGLWSPLPHFNLKAMFKYPVEMVYLDKNVIISPECEREFYSWYACFSPEIIRKELAEAGFNVKEILADVAGTPFYPESHEITMIAGKQ